MKTQSLKILSFHSLQFQSEDLNFRSLKFEVSKFSAFVVSTLNFQISHFPKFDSSFPFVSLVFSDDVRSLKLLDKQLRFRHCQPAFIPDERGP